MNGEEETVLVAAGVVGVAIAAAGFVTMGVGSDVLGSIVPAFMWNSLEGMVESFGRLLAMFGIGFVLIISAVAYLDGQSGRSRGR